MIRWSPWSVDAFARARTERKPVLLSIAATWCAGCREMDRTSYAEPRIVRLVNDRFVAIRVDADRRPDLHERYNLGGLPTTAFLTGGGAIAGGGTYVPPDRLFRALEHCVDAFESRRDQLSDLRANASARPHGAAEPVTQGALVASVFRTYDPEYGGFGTGPKFPLTAPLHLALALDESSPDSDMRAIAGATLDAMAAGGLRDEVDGGFFRCTGSRDWRQPRHEKLLDVNAALVRAFVDGATALNAARHGEIATEILEYARATLADPVQGGWGGSQQADPEYYAARTRGERTARERPRVDSTLYAGWNASMISAVLHAAQAMDEAVLAEFAIKSLERLLLACYRPGAGVAHVYDGEPRVRGLLDDQIAMAAAALDAAEATGRLPYEMMAEELGLYALRTMWDDQEGGLFDRAEPPADENVGLLAERLKPFVSNCEAARLFTRLAASSGNNEFTARAHEILACMEARAALEGPLAAHYVLARRDAGLR